MQLGRCNTTAACQPECATCMHAAMGNIFWLMATSRSCVSFHTRSRSRFVRNQANAPPRSILSGWCYFSSAVKNRLFWESFQSWQNPVVVELLDWSGCFCEHHICIAGILRSDRTLNSNEHFSNLVQSENDSTSFAWIAWNVVVVVCHQSSSFFKRRVVYQIIASLLSSSYIRHATE